ncbi:MAG: hypothetical protein WB425_16135 [Terracidiphilus sp.]
MLVRSRCAPSVAEAIRIFMDQWRERAIDSAGASLSQRLCSVIIPAWDDYLASIRLYELYDTVQMSRGLSWRECLEGDIHQYRSFEAELKKLMLSADNDIKRIVWHRANDLAGKEISRGIRSFKEWFSETPKLEAILDSLRYGTESTDTAICREIRNEDTWIFAAFEFHDTLGSLRQLIAECRLKSTPEKPVVLDSWAQHSDTRPTLPLRMQEWIDPTNCLATEVSFDLNDDVPSSMHTHSLCNWSWLENGAPAWCQRLTEMEEYLQGAVGTFDSQSNIIRLDKDFCSQHKGHDGVCTWVYELPIVRDICSSDLPENEQVDRVMEYVRAFFADNPRKDTSIQRVDDVAHRITCKLCGRRTEYQTIANIRNSTMSRRKKMAHNEMRKKSRDFCKYHRPFQSDGAWTPNHLTGSGRSESYQSRFDKIPIFKVELERLVAQSYNRDIPFSATDNQEINLFVMAVVRSLDCEPDHLLDMRRIAWEIVECDINDRKKRIIMLHAFGWKQADIAREFGVSRQAISEILKSIPQAYRFDIQQ